MLKKVSLNLKLIKIYSILVGDLGMVLTCIGPQTFIMQKLFQIKFMQLWGPKSLNEWLITAEPRDFYQSARLSESVKMSKAVVANASNITIKDSKK